MVILKNAPPGWAEGVDRALSVPFVALVVPSSETDERLGRQI
jgi:hypothetical protein